MKRLLLVLCVILPFVCIAQGRVVRGVVFGPNDLPFEGITVYAVGFSESTVTNQNGNFELTVSPYTTYVEVAMEGYVTACAEIDGSYLIIRLKQDKKYWENKAKAEAEARLAEQRRVEAERIAAEQAEAARLKAEEDARLAEQRRLEAERIAAEQAEIARLKAEEEARIAEQKRIEAERIAAEKAEAARLKAEEEARIAEQKRIEAERIAAEKAEAARLKAEEEARIAEQKRLEAERIAAEKAEAARLKAEEDARLAEQRRLEAERIAAEQAEAARLKAEEEARIAEQKRLEAERIAKEKAEIAAAKKEKRDAVRVEYAEHIEGYESFVNISYNMMSNESYAGLDYIGGYRFNNNIFFGAGAGVNMQIVTPLNYVVMNESLELSHGAFYFPVYAHFRAQLLNRRFTPFFAFSAGYNISLPQSFDLELISINYNASGLFVNPQVGVTYRVKTKLGIYCAAGFNGCIMPKCIANTGYSATIKQGFKYGININLGISF